MIGIKSEKLERNVDQLELKLEELESDQPADEAVEQLASDKMVGFCETAFMASIRSRETVIKLMKGASETAWLMVGYRY